MPLDPPAGWLVRSGCDRWSSQLVCMARIEEGGDFRAMWDEVGAGLAAAGWRLVDDAAGVVGMEFTSYVHPEHPGWVLYVDDTGEYEGAADALSVIAVLDPILSAPAAPAGLATLGFVDDAPAPWDSSVPWPSASAPQGVESAEFSLGTSFATLAVARLRLADAAAAQAFVADYAAAVAGASGWRQVDDAPDLRAFRQDGRWSALWIAQHGADVEVRAVIRPLPEG